jgi:hypothetical protein
MVQAQACNPSTQEAEAGDHEFQNSLRYIVRPCHKQTKTKKKKGRKRRGGGEKIAFQFKFVESISNASGILKN